MRRRPSARPPPRPRGLVPVGSLLAVCLLLGLTAPAVSAAKPVAARYQLGCDPLTSGDPFQKFAQGTYGTTGWTENFSSGEFRLPGDQYATSSGGASIYFLWPWTHFGPSPPASPTSCVVERATVATNLTFTFVQLRWSVNLSVQCGGDGSAASASYALNVTGDMYDYSASSWLVNRFNHANTLVSNDTVSCRNGGSYSYILGPIRQAKVVVTTGRTTYNLVAGDEHMYFAQPRLWVSATATGDASASATVSHVVVRLQSAHCFRC